jgi:hypothetical protein
MTSRDFCYWLQGFFELEGVTELSQEQSECIARHLALVFIHEIDPSFGGQAVQGKLNDAHAKPEPPFKLGGVGPNGEIYRC